MDTKNNAYPNLVTQTNSQAVLVKIILLDHSMIQGDTKES